MVNKKVFEDIMLHFKGYSHHYAKDSLYNCHPESGEKKYAQGVLVGLVSGLMVTGLKFEMAIKYLFALSHDAFDLQPGHVRDCLPECWIETWDKCNTLK